MAAARTPSLTAQTRVVAARGQLSANLSGEAVILGLKDAVYYGLAGSGARIWELVQTPATLGSVADSICVEFDVERERAMRDLIELAGELVKRGLLDVVPDTAP
jgi:hypothetical protein